MDSKDFKNGITEFASGVFIIGAVILIAPHIGNELWRNAHAVDLAIALLLLVLLLNTGGDN